MRLGKLYTALMGALILSLGAAQASADENRLSAGFGQPISEADIQPWDIDIHAPSGAGLPPGEGTVEQGRQVYEAKCLACHGEKAAGGPVYGSMVGGIGSMTERPRVLTPGSMYPYAPILFDYTRRAMPMDAPQSLSNDEVYAVSAYIYYLNELIDEDFKMNAETMAGIQMPNRDAFIVDDRPDAQAERCMSDCPPIGTVADAEWKAGDY
ncbi:c-type cytochrome [Thioalkalivibrio sp.]|uniref:c-type cytochrome n=1 Tax=Thioalkalivibrio sp. TaxID=2093813 RepID=UPI00356A4BF8